MSIHSNAIHALLESFERDDRSAVEDFHESSKMTLGGNKALVRRTGMFLHMLPLRHLVSRAWKEYPGQHRVPLPEPSLGDVTLEAAVRGRRSLSNVGNAFGRDGLNLAQLSAILGFSYGITGAARRTGAQDPDQKFRAAASAGGLYPVEIYPVVLNVDGLASGIYHYSVPDHSLHVLSEGDPRAAFLAALPGGKRWATAAVVFILTTVLDRSLSKYLNRGYRMAMIDCGALVQNLYLTTTGVGGIGCAMGGFYDDVMGNLLEIDNVGEVVALCFAAGALPDPPQ